jgi:electron transfer flavoprotein alpha subunit
MRTTAVGEVTNADGTTQTLVSSSERALSPAQRAALQKGETAVSGGKGVHAEEKIMNAAEKNGQTVNAIAPSRPACDTCAAKAASKNIKIVNPSANNPAQ